MRAMHIGVNQNSYTYASDAFAQLESIRKSIVAADAVDFVDFVDEKAFEIRRDLHFNSIQSK